MSAPGWYPDPTSPPPGRLRWWDGGQWTQQVGPIRTNDPAPLPPALAILPQSVFEEANRVLGRGEPVLFSLVGIFKEALVACADRCVIIKTGFMTGNTFGARSTSFQYADIQAIQTRAGLTGMGYLEIVTAGFPSMERSYWADGRAHPSGRRPQGLSPSVNADAKHAPNCVSANKRLLASWQPYLAQLEQLIRDAHSTPSYRGQQPSAGLDIAAQIGQLLGMHQAGALTDMEFAAAKARLLTGH
jgi:hypothetical protein